MKKWKAILAMVLALCLLGSLLVACASTTESAAEADNAATETSDTAAQGNEEEETASSEAADDNGELTEVIFWSMSDGQDYADRLNAAINEVIEPYGIHAEITHLAISDFASKVLPALMGGERVDLMSYPILCNVNTMVQNGMAMDITDELNTYAPDAMALMQDYVKAYTFNGKVYGLPTLRAYEAGASERLQAQYSGAWAALARNGNPNHEGLPNWTPYSAPSRSCMVFDHNSKVRDNDFDLELAKAAQAWAPPFR